MKSIKDLREQYNLVTEKEEHDMNKLTQLVRAGLFDAKKISSLKRAMDKPADKMTAQEKRMMINLLDALMSEVLSDKQVYRKVKQDVMKEETRDYFATPDPRVKRFGYPSSKEAPSVLLLKRKAIRVFPDGQKVALYYAQAIDKYVSVPFNEIGINEEITLDEGKVWDFVKKVGRGIANTFSSSSDSETKKKTDDEPKYLEPLKREPGKLKLSSPKDKETDDEVPSSYKTRLRILDRKASEAQSRIRESFIEKLDVLREDDIEALDWIRAMQTGQSFPGYGGGQFGGGRVGGGTGAGRLTTGITSKSLIASRKASVGKSRLSPVKKVKQRIQDTQQAVKTAREQSAAKAKVQPEPSKPSTPNREAEPYKPKAPEKMPDFKPYKPDTKPSGPTPKPANDPGTKPAAPAPGPKPGPAPAKPANDPGTKPAAPAPATGPKKDLSSKTGIKDVAKLRRWAKAKRLAKGAAVAGLAASALSGGSSSSTPEKFLDPLKGKLTMTPVGPKREGDPSSLGTRLSILDRKALEAQSRLKESIDLDGNLFEINSRAASKITSLYESLNKRNKKKMIEMMKESAESLEKVISFAARQ